MGRIVFQPDGPLADHRHETPPNGAQYPLGTVWECSCGQQRRRLDRGGQRDSEPWVWTVMLPEDRARWVGGKS